MRKRRLFLLLLAGAVFVCAVGVGVLHLREPSYGGRSLSQWVVQLELHRPGTDAYQMQACQQAQDAIRHIGTNAVPYLVRWIRYDTPPWKKQLYATTNRLLRRAPSSWYLHDKKLIWQPGAITALCVLGPEAKGAIPELVQLLNEPKPNPSAVRAAFALRQIGKEAWPALVGGLTNQDSQVRQAASSLIAIMGSNALPVLPNLSNLLDHPDPNVRRAATNTIQQIDTQTRNTTRPHPKKTRPTAD